MGSVALSLGHWPVGIVKRDRQSVGLSTFWGWVGAIFFIKRRQCPGVIVFCLNAVNEHPGVMIEAACSHQRRPLA